MISFNWSTDSSQFDKRTIKYKLWLYNEYLNFGIPEGIKLNKNFLVKNIDKLKVHPLTRNAIKKHLNINQKSKNITAKILKK